MATVGGSGNGGQKKEPRIGRVADLSVSRIDEYDIFQLSHRLETESNYGIGIIWLETI